MTFNLRILLKGHYSYIAPVETWYSLSVNLSRWAFVEYRSGQLFTPISHGLSFLFPVCLRNPITAPDHATRSGKHPAHLPYYVLSSRYIFLVFVLIFICFSSSHTAVICAYPPHFCTEYFIGIYQYMARCYNHNACTVNSLICYRKW